MPPLRQLKLRTLLLACILGSVCRLAVPVLDGAGIYFEVYTGLFGREIVALGFVIAFLLAVLKAVRPADEKLKRFWPLGVQVVALVLVYGFNVRKHVEKWNFESRMQQRLEVLRLVEREEIQSGKPGPCDCFYATLPDRFRSTSAGGEVLVSRHTGGFSVTFFVARWGMFPDDDYTAFIYRSDLGEPQTGEEDTDRFTGIELLKPHWFYGVHT